MQTEIVSNWSKAPPAVPWVIILITMASLLAKLAYSMLTPLEQQIMIEAAGAAPDATARMLASPISQWLDAGAATLFTGLFVHSGWAHLLGNLAYLWVFGVTVEQRLGAIYVMAVFFLGGALAHVMVALQLPTLEIPVIGSSGAVSAIVGAYLGLFPSKRIGLFLPLGLYLQFARVPALLVIGSWFTLQLVYSAFGPITGAVAWWTHLAGFVLGLMFAMMARAWKQLRN
ncbi:MAG: rhomboid family intramembrane serine protease [Xanthomonadales bacterium]|nr:rhomboid family intramembrane serine protease [Xanthomonadales bacterium]